MNTGTKLSYKLFIDDERFPVDDDWVIARSTNEAIFAIRLNGMPSFISFDHDLGGNDTSRVFIKWLLDELLDGNEQLPPDFDFAVHSQNPIGADWIQSTMLGIIREFS